MAKKKGNNILKEITKCLDEEPFKKLSPDVRNFLKAQLKAITTVKFPVITFKENEEWVASNPILGLSAQGETEEDSVECLKEMTNDFMQDPDTHKPRIQSIVEMQIGIKNVPVTLLLNDLGEHNVRNQSITA